MAVRFLRDRLVGRWRGASGHSFALARRDNLFYDKVKKNHLGIGLSVID